MPTVRPVVGTASVVLEVLAAVVTTVDAKVSDAPAGMPVPIAAAVSANVVAFVTAEMVSEAGTPGPLTVMPTARPVVGTETTELAVVPLFKLSVVGVRVMAEVVAFPVYWSENDVCARLSAV